MQLVVLRPIVEFLRLVDSDQAITGKVYHRFFALTEAISSTELSEDKKEQLLPLVQARWDQAHSELHAAGYALDPEFWDHDCSSNSEVCFGTIVRLDSLSTGVRCKASSMTIVTLLCCGCVVALIIKMLPMQETLCAMQVMVGFENVCSKLLSADDSADASLQHSRYKLREGRFGTANAKANASKMPAWRWWMQYGSDTPQLQKVAIKVLAQCSSACSCERNWSSYGFIHSKSRNRLRASRARDLVFVFSNLRLLRRVVGEDYEEQFPLWDSESEADSESEDE